MKKFKFAVFAIFCAVGFCFFSVSGEAYTQAPFNTEMKSIPMSVPFRIWVRPINAGGTARSGYYKYVQLEMSQPEAEALATPGLWPVIVPITPATGGKHAIPTM